MIRAIIFDCFGVLTVDTWRAFIDSLPSGVDIEAARELNRAYDAGLIDKATFLRDVREATGHQPHQVEEMLASEIVKNTQLLAYIGELKDSYKIGLLSNIATPWITDSFLTLNEQKLFDTMVFSYEAGMTKPNPRIFNLVCEKLQIEPTETVMVDDIAGYGSAAQEQGMKGIVYQDFKQLKRELEEILSSS